MNNNDIFKKLRVALQLRDDQIIEIMQLVDFRMSAAELSAFFRKQDHPNYMECGDQVLRNFLNGLIIHLRGTKEDPKDPTEVLARNKAGLDLRAKERFPKEQGTKSGPANKQGATAKKKPASNPKSRDKKPAPKLQVVEKVKFKNGKPNKPAK
jgi:hypothetical protein